MDVVLFCTSTNTVNDMFSATPASAINAAKQVSSLPPFVCLLICLLTVSCLLAGLQIRPTRKVMNDFLSFWTRSIALFALFESYCLPLLTFAAVTYNQQQVHGLTACSNTVYRTIFNFNVWESAKRFISGLGKLSLQYVLKVCKVKLYFTLLID